jgi:hypothetical protein
LKEGSYDFTIYNDPVYYNISSNGQLIAEGGDFGYKQTTKVFFIPYISSSPSMSLSPSHSPSSSSPTETCYWIEVAIAYDEFAYETQWKVEQLDGEFAIHTFNFTNGLSYGYVKERHCLPVGRYQFIIWDEGDDGLCCLYGSGNYTVTSNDELIAEGGEFGSSETTIFDVPFMPTSVPSATSSISSSPSMSLSPSHSPSSSHIPTETCYWIEVAIAFDEFPSDTKWKVEQLDGEFAIDAAYLHRPKYSYDKERHCLPVGRYQFIIWDEGDDGLCCLYGSGNYTVTSNDELIAEGGEFRFDETTIFDVPYMPTSVPSKSSSPSMSLSPSTSPSISSSPSMSLSPSHSPSSSHNPTSSISSSPSMSLSPSHSPSSSHIPTETCYWIEVAIAFDEYPDETEWKVEQLDGELAIDASNFTYEPSNGYDKERHCLPVGRYQFIIWDSAGDGLCCLYGSGNYTVTSNDELIAEGGEFGFNETTIFDVPYDHI